MHGERRTMTDGERVIHTANLLVISELELFRRSYLEWYGRDAEEEHLEGDFVRYLYFGETPVWVRQFLRKHVGDSVRAGDKVTRGTGMLATALGWLGGTRLVRFLTEP